MILAEKIVKLRKRAGWSQEDLAEKMDVSRQSVSKWESTASVPDLNKIILLAELFGVSTDVLLKDNLELDETPTEDSEPGIIKITIEEATNFIKDKLEKSKLVAKGVVLCVCSPIVLFFLLALSEGEEPYISEDVATGVGITLLLIMVALGVRFFLISSQKTHGVVDLENSSFELSYGVKGIIEEKLRDTQPEYTKRLSITIGMLIVSALPIILSGLFTDSDMTIMLMLVLMFVIIGAALYLMIPNVIEHNTYNLIIGEGDFSPQKLEETKRGEKFGAFYWPLVTAIYLGWSLITMNWGITWVVWPIAGVAFAGFVGLLGLLDKNK